MNIDTFKSELFSVPVWSMVLNNERHHILDYKEVIKDIESKEPSMKRSNSGGYQTVDNLYEIGVFKEFISSLENIGSHICQIPVKIESMWGNINYTHHCNYKHVHDGELSGCFYLQVPEQSGNLVFVTPAVRSESRMFFQKNISITPVNMLLVLFPGWLEHYVETNMSTEARISISFNFYRK